MVPPELTFETALANVVGSLSVPGALALPLGAANSASSSITMVGSPSFVLAPSPALAVAISFVSPLCDVTPVDAASVVLVPGVLGSVATAPSESSNGLLVASSVDPAGWVLDCSVAIVVDAE